MCPVHSVMKWMNSFTVFDKSTSGIKLEICEAQRAERAMEEVFPQTDPASSAADVELDW